MAVREPNRGKSSRREPVLELDEIIHERLRLGILSLLNVNTSLTWRELKQFLEMTDGNTNVHINALRKAGYVATQTVLEPTDRGGQMRRTDIRITPVGRRALERYLGSMAAIMKASERGK
jgi:DNA-binding MarR family transcriptional regulator